MSLTKSLHTVTAAVNVARLLRDRDTNGYYADRDEPAEQLALDALEVLGYKAGRDYDKRVGHDATVSRIVAQCEALWGEGK